MNGKTAWLNPRSTALLLAILVAGTLFTWWIAHQADRGMRENLLDRTRSVARSLNIERPPAPPGAADTEKPDRSRIRELLARARDANAECRSIHLMGRLPDGRVVSLADDETAGSRGGAPPPRIREAISPEQWGSFKTTGGRVHGPIADPRGAWALALVPVFHPRSDDRIAVLAMEFEADAWKTDILARAALPVGMTLASLIFLAAWLMSTRDRKRTSVKPVQRRLLIPLAAAMIIVVGGFGVALLTLSRSGLEQSSGLVLMNVVDAHSETLDEQADSLAALESLIVRDENLTGALIAGNRKRLLADWRSVFEDLRENHGVTHFYFHRPDRVNLLRVHKPEKSGDRIDRFTALEAERTGRTASGVELGPLGTFTLRVVRPVFDGETLAGYLELGKEIEDALAGVHDAYGVEVAVAIRKTALNRSNWEAGMRMLGREADWGRCSKNVLIYSSLPGFPGECRCSEGEGDRPHNDKARDVVVNGRPSRLLVHPLEDASGARVGSLVVLYDVSEARAALGRLVSISAGSVLVFLALMAGGLFVLLKRVDEGIRARQRALRESEERLDLAMAVANGGVWDWRLEDGLVLFDPRCYTMAGYKPNEFPSTFEEWRKRLHPDDHEPVRRLFRQYRSGRKDALDIEFRFRRKSGNYMWLRARGQVVAHDEGGAPARFVCTHADITEEKKAKEALKKSEEQYRLLTHNLSDVVWVRDMDLKLTYLSPSVETQSGYSVEEKMAQPIDRGMTPESLEKSLRILGEELALERGGRADPARSRIFRVDMIKKDGSMYPVEVVASFIRDDDGKALGIVGVSRDITERIRREEALRRVNERIALAADSAGFGVWDLDLVNNRLEWDDWMFRLYGMRPEDFGGAYEAWRQGVHPDDLARAGAEVDQAVLGEKEFDTEFRVVRPDGEIRHLKAYAIVVRDEEGRPVRMTGINYDITDRKQAEERLLETNRRLEEATARANRMAAEAESANVAKSEFLANMSHEIRTPMNGVIGLTGLLLETELSDEQRRYAETVRASGESLLGVINDILDFSKIEARKLDLEILNFDLQDLLDDFAATMALQAYDKGLELVCGMSPDAPALLRGDPGRLRQILTNLAGNAVKFTHEGEVAIRVVPVSEDEKEVLLHFSVRDTGIGVPRDKIGLLFGKFSQVDASTTRQFGGTGLGLAISRQLAEMMGGEIGVESMEGEGSEFWFTARLEKQPEGAAPPSFADLSGVRALVVDDNAANREILTIRLTSWEMRVSEARDGAGALDLLYRALDENDPHRVVIMDMQMPGMDGEALGRAIKSDDRMADVRMVLLTSLGVRGDARRFSEIGFDAYLTKPARTPELRAVLSRVLAEREGGTPEPGVIATRHTVRETRNLFAGRRARILLAEDNITNQKVALGMLKKFGLAADAVANGAEAVKALEDIPYDLVLMDVQMPVMDGLEATMRIRSPGSAVRDHDVPIVALTAHAMAGDREKCLRAGMDGYIAKPVEPLALANELMRRLPPDKRENPGAESAAGASPPGEEADADSPVWDRPAMLERLMGDDDLLRTVLDGFLDDIPRQIEILRDHLETGDVPGVDLKAHLIKGAAGNVSAEALRETAYEMEKAAKADMLEAASRLMPELEKRFEHVKREMTAWLALAG